MTAEMQIYAVIDAGRDYVSLTLARRFARQHQNLFEGSRGEELEEVAPHLFLCDTGGVVAHLVRGGDDPGENGVLIESPAGFEELRHHLRRHLSVFRERDMRRVFFRFYDPRVLRVFLPACNTAEVREFFGPIAAFHCQGNAPGRILTFRHHEGTLATSETDVSACIPPRYANLLGDSTAFRVAP